jgi:hypothetical protein
MIWTTYKVVLRLLTPMHIGKTKLGNVQQTRPYVPGRALWGALTARITRDNPEPGRDYVTVGQHVNEELAFSYFYPTAGDRVELWPWEESDKFAWRHLGSYASTALDYGQNAAEEGSLHETEFIAPMTRDGWPVCLVGYVFERSGCTLPWQSALNRLQLGGERGYGWGRVKKHSVSSGSNKLFDRYTVDLDGGRPIVHLVKEAPLLAHTHAYGDHALAAQGRLVPLVGRETRAAHAHGRHLSTAIICWEPGASAVASTQAGIGPYGIWNVVN